MNKLFLGVVLLVSSVLNLQASGQKCTYEFNCNNPEQITRIHCNGREEIIHLQPGEDSHKKIKELKKADEMRKQYPAQANSNNTGAPKLAEEKWKTLGIFTGSSDCDDITQRDLFDNSVKKIKKLPGQTFGEIILEPGLKLWVAERLRNIAAQEK